MCDSLRRSTQLSTLIYTLHTRVCYNKSHDKMTTILAFLVQSEVLLLFSCARKAARRVPILCVALCVRQKMRDRFFFAEKKRREEKKKIKKKKIIIERKVQKSSHQIALSSQIFRHASLFFGKIGSPHLFVTTTNDTRRSKSTHDIYNKKELSIISRSNKMMLMCVNCCVIHFSTFR